MQKEKNSGNIIDLKILRRLYEYIKPYSRKFYYLILLTLAFGILGPIRPLLVSYAIDDHIAVGNYNGLLNITIILVILLTASGIFQYLHTYLSGWLGQYIIKDLSLIHI